VAQRKLEPEQRHHRLLCVVPMIGSGTYEDPRRPLFAPTRPPEKVEGLEREESQEDPPEIVAYSFEESDDGKFAIVEFVARDRKAFQAILQSGRTDVRVFRKENLDKAEAAAEFRQFKRDFQLKSKGLAVQ
jgi:hypothetical protein